MRLSAVRMFPLLLVLALALVTLFLERAVRVETLQPSERRHDPDYIVERFAITTYGTDGRAESTLSAERMLHYPDDDSTELVSPRVVQTRPGEPRLVLTAARGAVSADGDEVFLHDDVLLVREGAAGRPETRMRSSFLHFVRERSLVRSDREVTIVDGDRRLQGRGLEYYNDTRQLYLRHDVLGRFEARRTLQ